MVLNLAGNRITTIDEAAFCCLPNLLNLDLSNNPLKTFDPNTFNGVRNHLQVGTEIIKYKPPNRTLKVRLCKQKYEACLGIFIGIKHGKYVPDSPSRTSTATIEGV